jgi:hypothetical protein
MIAHAIRSLRARRQHPPHVTLAIGVAGVLAGLRAGSLPATPRYEVYAVRYGTLERFPGAAMLVALARAGRVGLIAGDSVEILPRSVRRRSVTQ